MRSYSPLRYPGGKGQVYKFIEDLLCKNNMIGCTYIEPYAGGAGVAIRLLFEDKVKKIAINDFDRSIYAVWYSILNYTEEFILLIKNTDITMANWYLQKEIQKNKEIVNLLELGFSTFFLNRTNRSGIIKAGVIGGKNQDGNYRLDCRFNKIKLSKLIEKISTYRNRIELHNLDAIDFLNIVKRKHNQFYFIDPPYYKQGQALYTNFYQHNDHAKLAKYLKQKLKTKKFLISYDNCEEIEKLYSDYRQEIKVLNYYVETKRKGEEIFITQNITM